MVKEGTPGKNLLRAVEPGSRRAVIETYATRDAVDARKLPGEVVPEDEARREDVQAVIESVVTALVNARLASADDSPEDSGRIVCPS